MEFGANPKRSRHCENSVRVRSFYYYLWWNYFEAK